MKNVNFKKGSTTLEAVLCMLFILALLFMAMHIYFQALASAVIEDECINLSHMVVSCESFEEAEDMVASNVQTALSHYKDIDASTIEGEVDYTVGSEQEWKKGNFVTVTVSAKIVSPFYPLTGKCEKSLTVMIERTGA